MALLRQLCLFGYLGSCESRAFGEHVMYGSLVRCYVLKHCHRKRHGNRAIAQSEGGRYCFMGVFIQNTRDTRAEPFYVSQSKENVRKDWVASHSVTLLRGRALP